MCVCVCVCVGMGMCNFLCIGKSAFFFFSMTVNRRNGARFSYTPCLNLPKTENWDGFLMRDKSV